MHDRRAHGAFALRAAQQGPERELPAVRIRMMERFHESWWERHRWVMAIGVGGLDVAPVADLVRLLLARLRELPGSGSTRAGARSRRRGAPRAMRARPRRERPRRATAPAGRDFEAVNDTLRRMDGPAGTPSG